MFERSKFKFLDAWNVENYFIVNRNKWRNEQAELKYLRERGTWFNNCVIFSKGISQQKIKKTADSDAVVFVYLVILVCRQDHSSLKIKAWNDKSVWACGVNIWESEGMICRYCG